MEQVINKLNVNFNLGELVKQEQRWTLSLKRLDVTQQLQFLLPSIFVTKDWLLFTNNTTGPYLR